MAGNETAIPALLAIMRDANASPRDRLNAAVSASRVEKLQMPGEAPPESVRYLRGIIDDGSAATNLRRESAAACAYFERRSRKAALNFDVRDLDGKRREWVRVVNGCLRHHLARAGVWPERRDVLYRDGEEFEMPPCDPDLAISALLFGGNRQERRRRQKAIDQPDAPQIKSEHHRREILRSIASVMHRRLAAFNLAR